VADVHEVTKTTVKLQEQNWQKRAKCAIKNRTDLICPKRKKLKAESSRMIVSVCHIDLPLRSRWQVRTFLRTGFRAMVSRPRPRLCRPWPRRLMRTRRRRPKTGRAAFSSDPHALLSFTPKDHAFFHNTEPRSGNSHHNWSGDAVGDNSAGNPFGILSAERRSRRKLTRHDTRRRHRCFCGWFLNARRAANGARKACA